ncbi:hypothetical protein N7456_011513 [Penicillium angulare]|uniref:Uncharacterized protein n=1 Tax=Penicillium angulare TaxID=116970 RepID=A0A9W9ETT8_9EURO|nr:hypothetical protein N7456_011513 [Penicillium angulare]
MPALVHPGQTTRGQVFGCFIEGYIPSDTLSSTVCFDNVVLCGIQSLPKKSLMTEIALSAISCLFLGKATQNTSILSHGLSLYNSAIRQMSSMLQRGAYTDELFYVTFIFQELNVVYAPNGMDPWGTHVAGMNTLLSHYRAKAKKDPIVDIICRYEQKAKIVLATTEANFSESEYKYLMEPTNGDPLLEIFQIAVLLKDLKCELDSVNHHDLDACEDLLRKCYETQEKLTNLSTDGSLARDAPELQSYFTEDTCIPSSDPLFGPAYHFSSLENAMLFILIWAHLAILQPLTYRAYSLVYLRTGSTGEIWFESRFKDMKFEVPEAYADRIARALPFCFRDSTKMACARYSMFGLCIASFAYFETGNRAKHDWCRGVLDYMAGQGFEIAGYLSERSSYLWQSRWEAPSPLTLLSLEQSSSPFVDSDSLGFSETADSHVDDGYLDYSEYRTLIRAP